MLKVRTKFVGSNTLRTSDYIGYRKLTISNIKSLTKTKIKDKAMILDFSLVRDVIYMKYTSIIQDIIYGV